jgi:hypothetical protein
MKTIYEMLDCNSGLTRMIAREEFAAFSHSERIKSYKGKTVLVAIHNTMAYGRHGYRAACILYLCEWLASYSATSTSGKRNFWNQLERKDTGWASG